MTYINGPRRNLEVMGFHPRIWTGFIFCPFFFIDMYEGGQKVSMFKNISVDVFSNKKS